MVFFFIFFFFFFFVFENAGEVAPAKYSQRKIECRSLGGKLDRVEGVDSWVKKKTFRSERTMLVVRVCL